MVCRARFKFPDRDTTNIHTDKHIILAYNTNGKRKAMQTDKLEVLILTNQTNNTLVKDTV